jgi:hypothetical protein
MRTSENASSRTLWVNKGKEKGRGTKHPGPKKLEEKLLLFDGWPGSQSVSD